MKHTVDTAADLEYRIAFFLSSVAVIHHNYHRAWNAALNIWCVEVVFRVFLSSGVCQIVY